MPVCMKAEPTGLFSGCPIVCEVITGRWDSGINAVIAIPNSYAINDRSLRTILTEASRLSPISTLYWIRHLCA